MIFFILFFPFMINLQDVLSVVFMEQDTHNQLHGEFLNDFRPTDVITFPVTQLKIMPVRFVSP